MAFCQGGLLSGAFLLVAFCPMAFCPGFLMPLSLSSINWNWHKLRAKQSLHVTHWPCDCRLAASVGVRLRATKSEISAAVLALMAWERL